VAELWQEVLAVLDGSIAKIARQTIAVFLKPKVTSVAKYFLRVKFPNIHALIGPITFDILRRKTVP
jgi:hypothetical protein